MIQLKIAELALTNNHSLTESWNIKINFVDLLIRPISSPGGRAFENVTSETALLQNAEHDIPGIGEYIRYQAVNNDILIAEMSITLTNITIETYGKEEIIWIAIPKSIQFH